MARTWIHPDFGGEGRNLFDQATVGSLEECSAATTAFNLASLSLPEESDYSFLTGLVDLLALGVWLRRYCKAGYCCW